MSAFSTQLLASQSFAQQLKLGNNPTQIEKSAVLQLDSKNQGLLLTRLSDTTDINDLHPPDGMLIYLTKPSNNNIYEHRNGGWRSQSNIYTYSKDPEAIKFTVSNDEVNLNIPNASQHRGVVSTTSYSQTFYNNKTFLDSLISLNAFYALSDVKVNENFTLKGMPNTQPGYLLSTDANGKAILQTDPDYWIIGGNSLATEAKLGRTDNANLPIITNSNERMRITSDGKVGIGTTSPIDTLDVNGSFKLGPNGSSFERMGEGVTNQVSFGGDLLNLFTSKITISVQSFTINGVKKNAQVFINPRSDLYATTNLLGIGLAYTSVTIMWARASDDNQIEIGFRTVEGLPVLSLLGLLNPTITTTFDILYCNPK